MPRPKVVKVFGQKYKVQYDYKSTENYGLTDSAINTIFVDGRLPEDKLMRVFMHEVTHAVIHETPLSLRKRFDVEEVCDIVGFHILDTLQNNPEILEWVNEA